MDKRILLIDDDAKFRSVVAQVLRDNGHKVMECPTGADALIECRAKSSILAVVDGLLPDMDGVELLEQMRVTAPEMKVIFVSTTRRDTETYLKLTRELKVDAVVHKPVPPTVLLGYVDRLSGVSLLDRKADDVLQTLMSMNQEFARELPSELDEINTLAEKLKSGIDDKSLKDLKSRAHMLRGSAGTYGMEQVGTLMGSVEDLAGLVQAKRMSQSDACARIAEVLQKSRELANIAAPAADDDSQGARRQRLLVVTEDKSIGGILRPLKSIFEVDLCYENAAPARSVDADAVLVRTGADKTVDHACKIIKALKFSGGRRAPVSLWTQGTIDPSWSVYLGLGEQIGVPPNPESLERFADEIIRSHRKAKIMVVDDDLNFVRKVETALSYEGLSVQGFFESARILETLEQVDPDLLLLDGDMPGLDGFEICKILKSKEKWHDLPVVFVTALTDWSSRVKAFEAGADDYITKPVVNAELLARIKTRLGRESLAVDHSKYDSLTGLYIHRHFVEMAEAERLNGQCTLLFLTASNLEDVNRDSDPFRGDEILSKTGQLLSRRFRNHDLRGRWSGRVLSVCLPGVDKACAERVLNHLIVELMSVERCAEVVWTGAVISCDRDSGNIYKTRESLSRSAMLK